METKKSGANHLGLHAQNDRWGLGNIETINSDVNHTVLHGQNDTGSLGPIETSYSDPKSAVLRAKTTDKGCDKQRLAILELKSLFWTQKP